MRDQLLGATQPVLSISLDPGESVVAEAGQFAWMTDSIEMAAAGEAQQEPQLCVYTATGEPGIVVPPSTDSAVSPAGRGPAIQSRCGVSAETPCA